MQFNGLVYGDELTFYQHSGHDVGPFKAVEESIIAQLMPERERANVLGWYYMLGGIGEALGMLVSGWLISALRIEYEYTAAASFRIIFMIYAAVGIVKALLPLGIGQESELQINEDIGQSGSHDETEPLLPASGPGSSSNLTTVLFSKFSLVWPKLSKESGSFMMKITFLYCLSALSSSLVAETWVVYFFKSKFKLSEGVLGSMFSSLNLLCAVSNVLAGNLAQKFGNVPTMFYGHLPYALSIGLIPLPSSIFLAIAFLVLRYATIDLGQAPRQALISAAILPEERTAMIGLMNIWKTMIFTMGPAATGALVQHGLFVFTFELAAGIAFLYAFFLYCLLWGFQTKEQKAVLTVSDQ